MKYFLWSILTFSILFPFYCTADDFDFDATLIDKMKKSYSVSPFSSDLLGDKIDLASGMLKFEQIDVSIPGNFNIPVEFRREYNIVAGQHSLDYKKKNEMAGWALLIPQLRFPLISKDNGSTTSFLPVGFTTGKQCSGDIVPRQQQINPLTSGATTMEFVPAEMYTAGPSLEIPGQVSEKLLGTKESGAPSGLNRSEGFRFYTDSKWRISCIPQKNGTGEGYLAESPDGVKYHLDTVTIEKERALTTSLYDHTTYFFKVSLVEDRFGNWVEYQYSKNGEQLDKIISSDSREINISYEKDLVKTVSDGSKIWRYEYLNDELVEVYLPDGIKHWKYELSKIMRDDITQSYFNKPWDCDTSKLYPAAGSLPKMKVTHPFGVVGTFSLDWKIHGKTEVDASPHNGAYTTGGTGSQRWERVSNRRCSYLISVTEKALSSGDIWKYSYSENHGQYSAYPYTFLGSYEDKPRALHFSTSLPEMSLPENKLPENVKDNSINYKFTQIKFKTGDYIRYFYDRNTGSHAYEKIVSEQYFNNSARKVKEVLYEYERASLIGRGHLVGSSDISYHGSPIYPKNTKIITYDTTDFISENIYLNSILERDEYQLPLVTHEKSAIAERFIKRTYAHNTDKWVIGSPSGVYVSNSNSFSEPAQVSYTYHTSGDFAGLSLVYEQSKYGQWIRRYTEYHSDGNVKKVEFPVYSLNSSGGEISELRNQGFSDYHRGFPQIATYSSRYNGSSTKTRTAVVDNDGLITSSTDLNGVVVGYGYDALGRLLYVDQPDDFLDSYYSWPDEDLRIQYGLPPGRKISRCILNSTFDGCADAAVWERSEQFDLMQRLTHLSEKDLVNRISRVKTFQYNYKNEKTFESYWSADNVVVAQGTNYQYDVIGRLRKITLTDDANVVSLYDYLQGNAIRFVDPKGNTTITTYQAYAEPAYEQPIKIEAPEGITTDMEVNLYGNVTSITQSGNGANSGLVSHTEYRAYDTQQRLCKVSRGDVGVTSYEYNRAGEMTMQAQGVTSTDHTNCIADIAGHKKVKFTHDNMGELWKVDYQDTNTPDLLYVRDGNGNVLELGAGADVKHIYSYNSLNLPKSEQQKVGNRIFSLGYDYTSMGYLKTLTYPDGDKVNFAPNAFGLPMQAIRTRVGDSDYIYANDAVYYPTGNIDSFNYGNGYTHKTTLNHRKVPSQIQDYKDTTQALNISYEYDDNLNVIELTDAVDDSYSLTWLDYDGADRLTESSGNSGIGNSTISYDGLGNIITYSSKGRNLNYNYSSVTNRLESVSGVNGRYSSFSYDDRGNVYGNGANTFVFNLANQLVKSDANKTYIYDGHNRRVKQTDSNGTSYSVYSLDGTLLFRETDQGGVNYIYLGKKLIAKDGVIPEKSSKQHYRPYGESVEGAIDDIGYTGHKFDKDLGLSYMQQRYYDPVIGRFYSNDPVGFSADKPMMFNRYAYANNNPYKFVDPDGRQAYQPIGVYIGARLDGKSHAEASKLMADSTKTMGKATKELMSFTKGGTVIDVIETTNEVMNGENIKDNVAGMTVGEIAGAVTEKVVEKKFGKDAAEVAGAVVGKFSGDAAKAVAAEVTEPKKIEPDEDKR